MASSRSGPSSDGKAHAAIHKNNLKRSLLLIIPAILFAMAWNMYLTKPAKSPVATSFRIPEERYYEALAKCREILNTTQPAKARQHVASRRRRNPRAMPGASLIVLKNAIILDGIGNRVKGSLLLKDGIIAAVGDRVSENKNDIVIDLNWKFVSPGLIDMHSHVGLYPWPYLMGNDDVNETTNPITPFARAKDAFNPNDPGIRIISSGGVTTSLIIPGSANVMGGEGFVIKMRKVDTLSVEDMEINANADPEDVMVSRWMKMACGENPNRFYGRSGKGMPISRLGEAWLFRKHFFEASKLKKEQEDWCVSALRLGHSATQFPEKIEYESLIALLRGKVNLNIHCYETMDIETILRHSKEFNFTVSALHHALGAYLIPDIIKRTGKDITIATFTDHWGDKKETYQASVWSPKILAEAGIPVAIKSDHPILNAQHLMFEASRAHHYGLNETLALASVTSVPANSLGIGHRVGRIAVGYDADVVVWDAYPLALGATPLEVYIDGIPQFNTSTSALTEPVRKPDTGNASPRPAETHVTATAEHVVRKAIVTNIGKLYRDEETVTEGSATNQLSLIVNDGKLQCICETSSSNVPACTGSDCSEAIESAEYEVIDLKGGYVLPGLVAVDSDLGLSGITIEPVTTDGNAPQMADTNGTNIVFAVDGLRFGSKRLESAYKAGVLTAITPPIGGKGIIKGVSVAFKTGADSILDSTSAVIKEAVALHVQLGTPFKNDNIPTVSGQIGFLRRALLSNLNSHSDDYGPLANVYTSVVRGEIPLAAYVDSKDEIAALIRLKERIAKGGGDLRLVIVGGAEAHLVAAHLAQNNVPVVLHPPRSAPKLWTAQHVLTGAPLTNGTAVHVLRKHGVMTGLGVRSNHVRDLAWEAGWAWRTSGGALSENEAVGFITWNLGKIFGLKRNDNVKKDALEIGGAADFVAYDGSPFEFGTKIRVVAGGGRTTVLVDPKAY